MYKLKNLMFQHTVVLFYHWLELEADHQGGQVNVITLQLSFVNCHSLLMSTIRLFCKWQRTTVLIFFK